MNVGRSEADLKLGTPKNVTELSNGDQFVLSKAKTLGAHTNMYCIKHAAKMNPKFIYTFVWKVCTDQILS